MYCEKFSQINPSHTLVQFKANFFFTLFNNDSFFFVKKVTHIANEIIAHSVHTMINSRFAKLLTMADGAPLTLYPERRLLTQRPPFCNNLSSKRRLLLTSRTSVNQIVPIRTYTYIGTSIYSWIRGVCVTIKVGLMSKRRHFTKWPFLDILLHALCISAANVQKYKINI